jgi:hypothetical protein
MENEKDKTIAASFVKTVLTSEVKYVIGIILFVGGIVSPYYGQREDIALIKKDISTINSNHEAHIQDLTQQIKDLKTTDLDQQKQIIDLQKQIISLIGRK